MSSFLLFLLIWLCAAPTRIYAQLAQGGGLAVTALANTQSATVSVLPSLVTIGNSVTVETVTFTQTFATTPLGTWPLGTDVKQGTIGLGTLTAGGGGSGVSADSSVQTQDGVV